MEKSHHANPLPCYYYHPVHAIIQSNTELKKEKRWEDTLRKCTSVCVYKENIQIDVGGLLSSSRNGQNTTSTIVVFSALDVQVCRFGLNVITRELKAYRPLHWRVQSQSAYLHFKEAPMVRFCWKDVSCMQILLRLNSVARRLSKTGDIIMVSLC